MLLARLVAWLAAQHAFVRRFSLVMAHERHRRTDAQMPAATTLDIALAEPLRDPAHLLVLLRERLAQLELPAPTLDLRLLADNMARRAPPNNELFPTPQSEQDGLARLIERLQARLGPAQVQRLEAVADHRPERANRLRAADARIRLPVAADARIRLPVAADARIRLPVAADARIRQPVAADARIRQPAAHGKARTANAAANVETDAAANVETDVASAAKSGPHTEPAAVRPVCLLAQPEPLPERQTGPTLGGQSLQLLSGPERIESGWWDAALAERDYFIAQLPGGALVWIYRTRLLLAAPASGWFLQGRFA